MGAKPPWKDIPDTNLVPSDLYEVVCKELSEEMSKGSEDAKPKLMYVAQLKIQEPKAYKNLILYDRFTIGTEDDPEAEDPETWKGSFAARRLKQFVSSLKITLGDDMDDTCEAAEGQRSWAMVELSGKRTDPKTGRTYDESNRITAYYAVGSPGMEVGKGKPTVQAPATAPAATGKPAAPRRTSAPVAAKANGEDTDQTVKPKKVAKSETTECPICSESVPRAEFIAHVNGHSEGEEATE